MLQSLGAMIAANVDSIQAIGAGVVTVLLVIGIRRYGARHERRTRSGS